MARTLADKAENIGKGDKNKLQDVTNLMRYLNEEHWERILDPSGSFDNIILIICKLLSDLGMVNGSCPTFRFVAALCVLVIDGADSLSNATSKELYAKVMYIKRKFTERLHIHSATRYGHDWPVDWEVHLEQHPTLLESVYSRGLPVEPKVTQPDVEYHGLRFALRKPKDKFLWESTGARWQGRSTTTPGSSMMDQMFFTMI